MLCWCRAVARERAACRCEGEVPGAAPQKTQITGLSVGAGVGSGPGVVVVVFGWVVDAMVDGLGRSEPVGVRSRFKILSYLERLAGILSTRKVEISRCKN